MKIYSIFILVLLITFIHTDDDDSNYCGSESSPSSAKDCQNHKVPTSMKYCCFVSGKDKNGKESKHCIPLSEDSYNNIKKYIEDAEKLSDGGKIKKLDCNSNYLKLSLISLLLFLL